MNDFNVEPDEYNRLVRDAERMRAEVLREYLVGAWMGMKRLGAAIGDMTTTWNRRRRMNLSVPAPHR
jgi:hypothetical protein